jgi:hypothetical protein
VTGGVPGIAALRDRIKAAGENTDRLRMLLGMVGFEVLAAGLGLGVALSVRPVRFWQILAATGAGGLAGFLVRYPIAAGYRWLQRLRIRHDLIRLTADQRSALLLLLEDEPLADTQKLMAPFRREFDLTR